MASYDEAIPPGQAGKVTAEVRTENYRGEVQKGVAVTTSDPTRPQVHLNVKFNVVGSVQILPRPGLMFPFGQNWEYSGKLLIRKDPSETGELRVTDLTSSQPWLLAKARRVEKDEPPVEGLPAALAGDFIVEVSVADDVPRTQGAEKVRFRTGLAREPEVSVPVSVVLQIPMKVTPPAVQLPQPVPGKETVAEFTVTLRPGLDKKELQATASPDPFRVTVAREDARRYRGKVTWTPTEGDGTTRDGSIVLRIGDESQTLVVRVAGPRTALNRPPTPLPSAGSP